jgi:hypothetical protein
VKPAALLWLAPGLLAAAASAETYVVNPEGTGDFPTIQAAIDSAVIGDVIELTNGVFRGEGNRDVDFLGKSVTVRSQSGDPEACVIDCEASPADQHRGFVFQSQEGREAVLAGVTIRNACHHWGGGINCEGASPTIRNCVFASNESPESEGGGLFLGHSSTALVEQCLFVGNVALHGGGLSCCFSLLGDAPEIVRCTFVSNTADEGGGVRY